MSTVSFNLGRVDNELTFMFSEQPCVPAAVNRKKRAHQSDTNHSSTDHQILKKKRQQKHLMKQEQRNQFKLRLQRVPIPMEAEVCQPSHRSKSAIGNQGSTSSGEQLALPELTKTFEFPNDEEMSNSAEGKFDSPLGRIAEDQDEHQDHSMVKATDLDSYSFALGFDEAATSEFQFSHLTIEHKSKKRNSPLS